MLLLKYGLAETPLGHLKHIGNAFNAFSYDACLKAAVHHAVLTPGVLAGAVILPVCVFHKLLVGRIVFVGYHIAGALPAEGVSGGISPGGDRKVGKECRSRWSPYH